MYMTLTKAASILFFVLSALQVKAAPTDTLVVIFDRQNFIQGDSIEIEIYTEPYRANHPAQTLHVWIDNVKTGQRWKYRYPFLKGRCKIALKVFDSIPTGIYAFNFLLHDKFLTIKGKVLSEEKKDSAINYLAKAKNKIPIIDDVGIQSGGEFKIDHLLYNDSVLFSFSPAKQKKSSKIKIAIETPLDSVFIPAALTTEFISIGTNIEATDQTKNTYSFDLKDKKLLQEVILKTKKKKAIDEYQEKFVSSLFGYDDAKTLDFLDSDEALSYPDLMSYLVYKFPELVSKINSENGQSFLTHRNETVDIYVDEFMDEITSVSIQDVAMVRFFRQSLRLSSGMNNEGFGGTLAIYTKKQLGKEGNRLSNYTFYIKGYTPMISEWK
jgi:hypothetical protein